MKTVVIKANLLAGISHTIDQLKPEQKAAGQADPVEANRLALKALADCDKANEAFLNATKETSEKLKARYDELKAEAEKVGTPDSPERQKAYADATAQYRKDSEVINAESKAEPEKHVTFELSDEKHECLTRLLRLTVGQWLDSKLFVEAADALDGEKALDEANA